MDKNKKTEVSVEYKKESKGEVIILTHRPGNLTFKTIADSVPPVKRVQNAPQK